MVEVLFADIFGIYIKLGYNNPRHLGELCKYAFVSSGIVGIPTLATIETNKHFNLATYPLSTTYYKRLRNKRTTEIMYLMN
jgi:hypothetical protein